MDENVHICPFCNELCTENFAVLSEKGCKGTKLSLSEVIAVHTRTSDPVKPILLIIMFAFLFLYLSFTNSVFQYTFNYHTQILLTSIFCQYRD